MKTGKYFSMGVHNNVKIGYGTVDFINLKSIYLKLNSWLEPKENVDFNLIIRRTRKQIIEHFYNIRHPNFKRQCLVDLDIRINGIKTNKRSFMNLEITLFTDQYFNVKDCEIKKMLKDKIINIIDNILIDDNLYNFKLKKIDNSI